MLFPSIEFALFFSVVLTATWIIGTVYGNGPRKLFLLVASLYMYSFWSVGLAGLLVLVGGLTYAVGLATRYLSSPKQKRAVLALGIAAVLGVLGYFKYYNFLALMLIDTGITGLTGLSLPFLEIAVPVAISFFVFHAISYMVDSYKGKFEPTRSLPDVLLYLSFFPHLVAGPIVRAADFFPQLRRLPAQTDVPYADSLMLIVGGLFKKMVMANYLAVAIVDPVFTAPDQFGSGDLLLGTFAYSFQIYFDFSAYTSIAIGLAGLLGYRFPDNFNQPYRSLSPREFWTRWHITLSTWLRDYLYIPLGGNRFGRLLTYRNLMITMLLGGLWHGAALTFVAWGAVHGIALVANHLWAGTAVRQRLAKSPVYAAACLAGTFVFVSAAWVLFRAADFSTAMSVFRGIFTRPAAPDLATAFLLALLALGVVGQFLPPNLRKSFVERLAVTPAGLQWAAFSLAMFGLLLLAPSEAAPFIYFQF